MMRLRGYLPIVCLPVFLSVPCIASTAAAATGAGSPQLPFAFVENQGQYEAGVRYLGNGPEFKAWFRDGGVTFQQGEAVATVRFVNAQEKPRIEAAEPIGATVNYLRGADPQGWKTDLPLFGSLRYSGVWAGIEIRFKADKSRTKAEYEVAPGASVDLIRLRFDGETEIESDGSLTVAGTSGKFHEDRPLLFEEEGANRIPVQGAFKRFVDGTIGFTVRDYDRKKPLIIDPSIAFSGYFGGSAQSNITAVAVNSYYNTIVAGWTLASDLPAANGARPHTGGGVDAFVAGFNPSGALVFCTYLGGSGDDRAFGLALDSANNSYVTGWSSSANFPVFNAVQPKLSGTRDAFIAKLNASGNALVYSTYLGGSGVDLGNAIALDSTNAVVIVGDTTSTNLAVTAGAAQSKIGGNQDAFIARLSPAGTAITFMTYFGGMAADHGAAIKVDASGSVYIGGYTYSPNFPTVKAWQPKSGGGQDGFVAKLSSTGTTIIFSTYIGGSGGTPGAPEEVNALALSSSGTLFVAGTTSSLNFPVTAGVQQPLFAGGLTDGFLSRFDTTAGSLQRSTYLGASGDDGINAMVLDYFGYIYIAGYTTSWDFPARNPVQSSNGGGMDAFVIKMLPGQILYAMYLGGTGSDAANAIAIDSMTSVVIAGSTGSWDFPVAGNIGPWQGSSLSSFITKIVPSFTLNVVASPVFYFDNWHDTGYNGPTINLSTSSFGLAGDIPVTGDWDGSGVKRIGVFRNGTWLLDMNGNGIFDSGDKTVLFGQPKDIPVVGDWNGTGRIKLGLFRQGTFILDLSGHLSGTATGLADVSFPFGLTGDIPIASDWNQTGTSKVGVFRNGLWLIDYNGDRVFNSLDKTYSYGQAGDVPVIGDWSGSGVSQIGVYRNGLWILNYGGTNSFASGGIWELYLSFGAAGYVPLVR